MFIWHSNLHFEFIFCQNSKMSTPRPKIYTTDTYMVQKILDYTTRRLKIQKLQNLQIVDLRLTKLQESHTHGTFSWEMEYPSHGSQLNKMLLPSLLTMQNYSYFMKQLEKLYGSEWWKESSPSNAEFQQRTNQQSSMRTTHHASNKWQLDLSK